MAFDLLANLAAVLAPSLVVTLAGYVWARGGWAFDQDFVTRLVVNVGTPALVFSALTRAPLSAAELTSLGVAAFLAMALCGLIGAAALRAARLHVAVCLPAAMFPNTGNMGLPISLFAFGDKGLALATVYFAVSAILQFTAGPAIAAGRFDISALIRAPFLYPVLAALVAAGLQIPVPQWAQNTLSLASGLTIPLMLLSLGAALARLEAAALPRAVFVSLLRLGIGAGAGFAAASAFGLDGAARGVLVLQTAMPAAVFNYLFARLYDKNPEDVAGVILVSTTLSYLTLPFLVAALL